MAPLTRVSLSLVGSVRSIFPPPLDFNLNPPLPGKPAADAGEAGLRTALAGALAGEGTESVDGADGQTGRRSAPRGEPANESWSQQWRARAVAVLPRKRIPGTPPFPAFLLCTFPHHRATLFRVYATDAWPPLGNTLMASLKSLFTFCWPAPSFSRACAVQTITPRTPVHLSMPLYLPTAPRSPLHAPPCPAYASSYPHVPTFAPEKEPFGPPSDGWRGYCFGRPYPAMVSKVFRWRLFSIRSSLSRLLCFSMVTARHRMSCMKRQRQLHLTHLRGLQDTLRAWLSRSRVRRFWNPVAVESAQHAVHGKRHASWRQSHSQMLPHIRLCNSSNSI